ncbi:Imm1 family immunity protein [Amycolatopsis sp. NPDC001319]|uniref:Imm1 family immunity protein n=1 Tax=unclassified Amycolatopsis TaxID=2618356 RepID=UPI0036B07A06
MSLTAYGPTFQNGEEGGFNRRLTSADDVRQLVDLLAQDGVFTATVESEHGVVDVHVQHGYGYLLYNGEEMIAAYAIGDPASPEVTDSETGFPAGSGIPLDQFTNALLELLKTGRLPQAVRWNGTLMPAAD